MEISLRLAALGAKLLLWILYPIFWAISLSRRRKLTPITNKLLFLSATTLAEKIRKREIKSEEIVRAYIDRIREVNPIINAVVEDRFQSALEDAKSIDAYLNSTPTDELTLKLEQPLLGVPLTVKESCSVKGLSFCVATNRRKGLKAEENGKAVGALIKAGAVPLLVSNTPEYCLYWEVNNLITGCTRNPYNTNYSAGGSSGGEGALLGSGASLIGIGSDIAGSVRLPALFNGVFGHKPTPYVVSVEGHFPPSRSDLQTYYLGIGPITRYAKDLELMLNVLAESNRGSLKLEESVDLSKLKIFYMQEAGSYATLTNVDKQTKVLVKNCVEYLRDSCGADVADYKFAMENTAEISSCVFFSLDQMPAIIKEKDNLFLEVTKSVFQMSSYSMHSLFFSLLAYTNGFVSKTKNDFYQTELNNLKTVFLEKLKDNGVFIYPTFPSSAFQHNQFIFQVSSTMYLAIFNLLGFPCTHVPLGLNKDGLPTGIQVVAAPYEDKLCLAVARELERGFGGWIEPKDD